MLLKIAFRNVLRNKRRTILTSITIAFGLYFFLVFDSMMTGIDRASVENLVYLTDGAIKVYDTTYYNDRKGFPINIPFKDYDKTISILKNIKSYKGHTPRTLFLGELNANGKSQPIVGTIINPTTDESVFTIKKFIIKGSYLSESKTMEVMLGKYLAEEFNVNVGDSIIISSKTKYGAYNADSFTVAGIIESSHPLINDTSIFMSYNTAQSFLNLENNITELNIQLEWQKWQSVKEFLKIVNNEKELIKKSNLDTTVLSFYDASGSFLELMKSKQSSQQILVFFILLIGAVGIVNTILMSVYERIREIGVLKSMGLKPGEIKQMFILEGIFIGITGGLIGLFLGFITNIFLVYVGYDITAMITDRSQISGMPIWGRFYGQWNFMSFIIAFIFGIILSMISAYIPAKKASKMQVTECIRFV